jgi:tetratricopeptide (TPR) repeat protein
VQTGSSTKGDIVTALLALERDHATGVLDFRAQGVLTRVFVDKGVPIFAEAGVLGETLGHVLVREGVLTSGQFAAVVRKMTDAIVDDENVRFGEVIVELGILSKPELDSVLAAQVEKKIIGCVPRGEGEWTFDTSRSIGDVARQEAPIRTLLVDAAKLLPESRIESVLKQDRATFPRLTDPAPKVAETYGLEADEVSALDHLDGTRETKDVIAAMKDADALLAALVMGGSVELLESALRKDVSLPPPAPISVTGRRRALRSKLVAHGKAKEAVERITREIDEKDATLPQTQNPRQATVFAEDEFQSGRRLFLQGKLEAAHVKLELASQRSPNVPLYRLYEELTLSRVKGKFDDAASTKRLATQIVKEDAECAFAYYTLAYLALEEGTHESAKRFFRHAFRLDSDLVDAGRQARLLEMRREPHGQKLHIPTPLKEILPRGVREPAKSSAASPSNRRTRVLVGALGAVILLAVIVLIVLRR